ncbi:MAG: universal stress protein, partial [Actinobacteria bacterium]|nr:universal stress protein [Actinomycetota bacterium]
RPDLLVLGVGHRWLRGRFLRPSVVGAVLAHADGDVLIVRTERARAAKDGSMRAAA